MVNGLGLPVQLMSAMQNLVYVLSMGLIWDQ